MHEVNVPRVALRGDRFTPRRTGSQHPDGGPTGLFRCSDGSYINITALAHQWGALAAAMGRPELAHDPRYKDARARRDELLAFFSDAGGDDGRPLDEGSGTWEKSTMLPFGT